MAIKIAPRATISDDFKQAMDTIYRAKLEKLSRDFKYSDSRSFMRRYGRTIALLKANLTNPQARDMLYTRLRGLPYTAFDFVVHCDYPYLHGTTKDIVIEHNSRQYSFGEYQVYVPLTFFPAMRSSFSSQVKGHEPDGFQFVPVRNPLAHSRTPHHTASQPGAGVTDPLMMIAYTCWGGFSSIIMALGDECDIVELFRSIAIYLTRYDAGSPLESFNPSHGMANSGFPFARAL
jgi:hypothetical protein